MPHQTAKIDWHENGTPVSTQFNDPYFSLLSGLDETTHVFLDGNDLPARFTDGFHIAELGFGTGRNMLAALKSFRTSGQTGTLHFTSFEAFPMTRDDLVKSLALLDGLDTDFLTDQWTGKTVTITTENLRAEIIMGDAQEALPKWHGTADAWFLDGFSPEKNPDMWTPDILSQVATHTKPQGTFATYTAAGHVRRALKSAGFAVKRRKGFGKKWHMSVGHLS